MVEEARVHQGKPDRLTQVTWNFLTCYVQDSKPELQLESEDGRSFTANGMQATIVLGLGPKNERPKLESISSFPATLTRS